MAAVPKPTICWNSSICERIRQYILRQNLTHVYVGGPSKCADSTIVEYLGYVPINKSAEFMRTSPWGQYRKTWNKDTIAKKDFRANMRRSSEKNCPYAVTGSHLTGGLEKMLKTPCSGKTLFLVSVRKLRSWFPSAVRTVCTKVSRRADCTTSNKEQQVVRSLYGELRNGPMDEIKEKDITDSRFHVLLVNYTSIMKLLYCLPPGGINGTKSTTELAAQIHFRGKPRRHNANDGFLNDAHFHEFNSSTPFEELFAIYGQATNHGNWLRQYLEMLDEGGCEVGSWASSFQEDLTSPMQWLASADAPKAKAYVEQLLIRPGREHDGTVPLAFAQEFPLPKGVESMTCTLGQCEANGPAKGVARQRIAQFEQAARTLKPITDKVTMHSYQTMYGMNLLPFMQANSDARFFEIGLGCSMNYGPGASVALWKSLFPNANLWEAEFDSECVRKSQAAGLLGGVHVVTGDQGNHTTVQGWVAESGGDIDVVIDDGGHKNQQIRTTFETLWPHVKPGGIYFLEDLQVGRSPENGGSGVIIADMVEAWVEQLLTETTRVDLPLPKGVQSIFCQAEACMLKKARP